VIDLHSHILPGLDDGAADLADALEIARAAAADGITAIAATPHVREDYPTTADAMESGVRHLRVVLEREGIGIELLPGGEVSLDRHLDAGRRVVLTFVSPSCGPCEALLPDVARWQRSLLEHVAVLVISSEEEDANRALAEEQPVAIAVDEAHYADGASIDALGGAMAALAAVPLLLVLTTRGTYQETSRALVRLISSVGRSGGVPGHVVQLDPLSAAETGELVRACSAWCANAEDRDRLARRIHFETSGNPFLIVTMLRGLARASVLRADALAWPRPGMTIEEPLPMSVPSLARQAVAARVAELDQTSLQVLRAASIGALAVDPELIAALTELTSERVDQVLTVLERHGLLAFDGERYRFAAPLIAEVVRGDRLLPGERRALRARAAAALAGRQDLESRLLRVELLARIGPAAVAFAEAVAAARTALAESAPRAARRALAAAERTLAPADDVGRRTLAELRARVLTQT